MRAEAKTVPPALARIMSANVRKCQHPDDLSEPEQELAKVSIKITDDNEISSFLTVAAATVLIIEGCFSSILQALVSDEKSLP